MITKQHIKTVSLKGSIKELLSVLFIFSFISLSGQENNIFMDKPDAPGNLTFPKLQDNNTLTAKPDTAVISNRDIEITEPAQKITPDSIQPAKAETKKKTSLIDSEVKYSSKDSTKFDKNKVFLFGDASVSYKDILLTAYYIEMDLDSNIAFAKGSGVLDSLGVEKGLPVFKDKSGEYTMRTMRYNFKTEKAYIEHVVTEQGEGYVVSDIAKKNADDTYIMKNGRYTTCDNHDHPHYYINMTRAKVIPGKKIVTGPAYLVIEDVKFYPLMIPFAFVPFTSSYSSGIILPSYGEESNRGFFLREGGYYWAANDYFDLTVTGDIYGNNSWGLRTSSKYKKLYKYSGNVSIQKLTTISSEKDLPDYSKTNDVSVTWSHSQDAKANPYSSLSASVNFTTSSYDKNNIESIIDTETLATTTKRSSISYSKKFPGKPYSLSGSLQHSQNSTDTTIDLTIPDLTFTLSSLTPFKSKNKVGSKESWYEKIKFSYTGTMKNYISARESEIGNSSLSEDWKNGVKHTIPVSMNMKLLNYFTVTPSVNYTERWYFKSITQDYDYDEEEIVNKDTTTGFFRVFDYSYSVSTSTKLYTFFKPSKALFGDKIQAIRHVMTPSVSLSYRPDFSNSKFGYYDWFEYYDSSTGEIVKEEYSKFENALYGTPSSGESGSMGISLGNTLEMKVKSDKDTTGFKKISILESLSFSTSYNFLADSLKLSKISMSGRTKLFGTSISFGASFDPYVLDTLASGTVTRFNKFELKQNQRLARLESANLSFGFNFGSETFKKKKEGEQNKQQGDNSANTGTDPSSEPNPMGEENSSISGMEEDEFGYAKFEMPWSLSVNYSMRITQGTFNKEKMAYNHKFAADVNLSGKLSLTQKWDLSMSSGYNFESGEISQTSLRISRNLHCWNMSFNLVPFGTYKSYFFSIAISSSLLQDLKYEKRTTARDSPNWY